MPSIIIIQAKNTPTVKTFARECSQIMQVKGYTLIATNPITFLSMDPNISVDPVSSTIKMIKAIQSYAQIVQKLYFSNTFRSV